MIQELKQKLPELWRHPAIRTILFPWAVAFLILQLVNTQDGGPNAVSRFLTLRSMSEKASFTIDTRIGATTDWAHTPDGHYYSNKAPGPMLLGFPVFVVLDQIPRLWEKGFRDEFGERHVPGYFLKTWTSLLNQALPLLILLAMIIRWLQTQNISRMSQVFFLLAVFFGSTVSLYYNNYSGHGFEAILQLALVYAIFRERYRWVGFFAGAALLSDYGFGIQLPALVAVLCLLWFTKKENILHPIKEIVIGGLIPGALWIWYHMACYGSPFLIANNFQNPIFLDTAKEDVNLWGIFRVPNFHALYQLTIGPERGILYTQPWILLLFPFAFCRVCSKAKIETRIVAIFSALSLISLLVMNMSYGGWAGGGTAGPRYLSGIFLCFALWITLELDQFPKWLRVSFWSLLGFSLFYRAMVYGSTILAGAPLWDFYFSEFRRPTKTPQLRFAIFTLILIGTWIFQKRLWKRTSSAVG